MALPAGPWVAAMAASFVMLSSLASFLPVCISALCTSTHSRPRPFVVTVVMAASIFFSSITHFLLACRISSWSLSKVVLRKIRQLSLFSEKVIIEILIPPLPKVVKTKIRIASNSSANFGIQSFDSQKDLFIPQPTAMVLSVSPSE